MTNPKAWLLLIPAILVAVTASLALKGALEHSGLYVAPHRHGPRGRLRHGIWGAAGVALTAVGSLLIFGEPIATLMSVGIIVIIAGVLCVELDAQAAHKKAETA